MGMNGRVYELRTYTAREGKLDGLKARFRDHVLGLFEKHGMDCIGFWKPQDGERSKDTLIYILAHPTREEAARHWSDFLADPEWKKVVAETEVNGKLAAKIESVFLEPTEFSKLK
jgi:hypothetical protein